MEENVKLLQDYSDANQNVRNLAYHIKALQVNPNSKNLKILYLFRLSHAYFGFKSISNVILTCQEHNHRKKKIFWATSIEKITTMHLFVGANFCEDAKKKKKKYKGNVLQKFPLLKRNPQFRRNIFLKYFLSHFISDFNLVAILKLVYKIFR